MSNIYYFFSFFPSLEWINQKISIDGGQTRLSEMRDSIQSGTGIHHGFPGADTGCKVPYCRRYARYRRQTFYCEQRSVATLCPVTNIYKLLIRKTRKAGGVASTRFECPLVGWTKGFMSGMPVSYFMENRSWTTKCFHGMP